MADDAPAFLRAAADGELPRLFAKAYLDTPYYERSEACERLALMALRALSGRRTTAEMYDTFERLACSLELDLREVA
jgi:hypothetical protein